MRSIADKHRELFALPALGSLPRVDLHMHTLWTDGANTVAEMYRRANEIGIETILFSEHTRATSGDWFATFADEVREFDEGKCVGLVGSESKIADFDGNLDIADAITANCDLIMASVHRFPGEQGTVTGHMGGYAPQEAIDIEFRLSMAALDNPGVDILGHPFGMTYSRFKAVPPWDLVEELIAKAAARDVAFEVNARYHPDVWRFVEACRKSGATVSFGSNAHNVDEVGAIMRALDAGRPA